MDVVVGDQIHRDRYAVSAERLEGRLAGRRIPRVVECAIETELDQELLVLRQAA
jgi:hypothetical protein